MIKITPVDGLFRIELVHPKPPGHEAPALLEVADDLIVHTVDAVEAMKILKAELLPSWDMSLIPLNL